MTRHEFGGRCRCQAGDGTVNDVLALTGVVGDLMVAFVTLHGHANTEELAIIHARHRVFLMIEGRPPSSVAGELIEGKHDTSPSSVVRHASRGDSFVVRTD